MSQQEEGKSVLSLERVSFTYEGGLTPAVRELDFSLGHGDFLGVIGPSGAGKTTFASILSGAVPHHYAGEFKGVCRVAGMDTCEVGLTDISRQVGCVLQDIDAQMVASNVEDEMLYGLENFGVSHHEIPDRINEALATCGIADLLHREIATLSGGQKQKLAIAAILAIRPQVMVLDEPTAALDPVSSRMVFDTLRRLNEQEGVTVVIVEQKVALLSEYCRRIAVMQEGSIVLAGTPREVFSHSVELREMGVDSPRVTRVSNLLYARGLTAQHEVSLTVGEAQREIGHIVRTRDGSTRNGGEPEGTLLPSDFVRPPHDAPALSCDHVSFSYPGSAPCISDLSFDVRPGEILAIVGQNGAGKTTTTKLMNGLLKPSSGSVSIVGLDTSNARTSEIARHVSTLFQDPDRQICKESVVEEVAFSLQLLGTTDEEALGRARDAVEYFGLPASAAPFSLGRGQRQIVALASVVVTNPEVLILDEPTSGLDYRECMVVMNAVVAARERGCAVVMVCHDMEVVSDFATRILVMADGRMLADASPEEVFCNEGLLEKASVSAPQVVQLSEELARSVSAAYAGVREVHDIVSVTERLVS